MGQQVTIRVDWNGAMHLTADTNPDHLVCRKIDLRKNLLYILNRGAPPDVEVLLGPARTWCVHLLRCTGAGKKASIQVNQCSAGALGANVDPH